MTDWAKRWRLLQGDGLFLYSRLLSFTERFRVEGWENYRCAQEAGKPLLWSLWHGQMMAFVSFGDRHLNAKEFCVITVGDERGDTLSTLAHRLGGTVERVDMGGNPVAAGRAVVRVIQAMKSGKHTILAPDGPDGPTFVPKPGVAFLARKAQATIIPVGVWTRQALQLNRWDRYLLPLPFARLHVALGAPLFTTPDVAQDDLLVQITEALHAARDRAQVLAGIQPWR